MTLQSPSKPLLDALGRPHILIVSANVRHQEQLAALLRRGYSVRVVNLREEALAYLSHASVDLIIADAENDVRACIDFFVTVHQHHPHTLHIITLPANLLDFHLSAIHQARIDFFITTPFRPPELTQAVEKIWRQVLLEEEHMLMRDQNENLLEQLAALRSQFNPSATTPKGEAEAALRLRLAEYQQRTTQLEQLNQQLTVLATTDPLTSLFNRREFQSRLTQEWSLSKRHKSPISVLMIDIDHFKRVNDDHGHPCGDKILRLLGQIIRAHTRMEDISCRYGGEEFTVILPQMSLEGAFLAAEKLRTAVATHPFSCKRNAFPVTISVGLATTNGHGAHGIDNEKDLVSLADQGLYRAKETGRNRTVALAALTPGAAVLKETH